MAPLLTARGHTKKPLGRKPSTNKIPRINIPRPTYPALARQDSVRPSGASSSVPLLHLRGARYEYGGRIITKHNYERLLASPHRADIKRLEPYLFDDNGRSVMLRNAEHLSPTPRRSGRSGRSGRSRSCSSQKSSMTSPKTPVKQQCPVNGRQSDSPTLGHEEVSGLTPDVPAPPPKDTPRPVCTVLPLPPLWSS